MVEFLGGHDLESATAVYITASGGFGSLHYEPLRPAELWRCLEEGLDVGRSLWDRRSLIFHVDFDYFNPTYPGEPYLRPHRAFNLVRPVMSAFCSLLEGFDIRPLRLISGRGYHLLWRVGRDSRAFSRLARKGRVPVSLQSKYAQAQAPANERIEPDLGAAYSGAGLVLEYLAHEVMKRPCTDFPVPVEITAVRDPEDDSDEAVSIDLSEYADPLFLRGIRVPFSVYRKPEHQLDVVGRDIVEGLPQLVLLPVGDISEKQGLEVMRDASRLGDHAETVSTAIPEAASGVERLVDSYTASSLGRFHERFYSVEQEVPEDWPDTYDRFDTRVLPGEAREALERPNDLLLRPAGLRAVTRALFAAGWHSRHISGLVRSKYERDFGWGHLWYQYDATSRADFYTRIFAGLIDAGLDVGRTSGEAVTRVPAAVPAWSRPGRPATATAVPEPPMEWPVGLSTGCFYHRDIQESLPLVREGGFSLVEVCSSPSHLDYNRKEDVARAAELALRLGIDIFSFHAPFGDAIDISHPVKDERSRAVREVLAAADAAAALGARYFVLHPGPERRPGGDLATLQAMRRTLGPLDEVSAHCREMGVGLVLENMLPHLFAGHISDILWILGSIASTDVGVCLDTGHAHISGELPAAVAKLAGHLWMLHANDNRGTEDTHLPPGRGTIAWKPLVGDLVRAGFRGVMMLELREAADAAATLELARSGHLHLRNIFQRAHAED
jgi:sugar phosphate isomerase/epimerase